MILNTYYRKGDCQTKEVKIMKNTTNWHLYKSSNSGETKLETKEPENNNSELLRKIRLIEKVFK